MKKSTIIIIVVIALLAIWGVTGYNGLIQPFAVSRKTSLPVFSALRNALILKRPKVVTKLLK